MHKSYSALKHNKSYSAIKHNISSIIDNNFLSKINLGNEEESKNNNIVIYDNSISLLKHKIFLEKILHLVKLSQLDYLSIVSSNQKSTGNKENNIHNKRMIIKNILLNLKKDLMVTLIRKIENKNKMQNRVNNNKSYLVKNIFGYEEENNEEVKSFTERKNNLIKRVNSNDNNNNNIYKIELSHLKLMNFKIINKLEYITNLIRLKAQSSSGLLRHGYVFCDNQNNKNKVSEYLHDNLIIVRDQFKSIVKQKDIQNRTITLLTLEVTEVKKEVEFLHKNCSNVYINTSKIINEESREFYTKTNITTMEDYKDNKKNINKNLEDNSFMKKNILRINNCN